MRGAAPILRCLPTLACVLLAAFARPPLFAERANSMIPAVVPYAPYAPPTTIIGFEPQRASLTPFEQSKLETFLKEARAGKCVFVSIEAYQTSDRNWRSQRVDLVVKWMERNGFDPAKIFHKDVDQFVASQAIDQRGFKDQGEEGSIVLFATPFLPTDHKLRQP